MANLSAAASIDPAALRAWLIEAGMAGLPLEALLDGFCTRLACSGFPIARGYASFATLHPLLWATGVTWEHGRTTGDIPLEYGFEKEDAWLSSPFRRMVGEGMRRMRRRLTGEQAELDFPVLHEFRAAGLTDWLALVYRFGDGLRHDEVGDLGAGLSWATDKPGGWSPAELALIEELSGPLALAVKACSGYAAARDLLATYLGRDAAERVTTGQIRRGSVERRDAVILYADLRDFTAFTDTTAPEEVIRRLNDCFDAMGGPVKAAGGEVLKFLGDGLLAMFMPDASCDIEAVAAAALGAAHAILERAAGVNATEQAAGKPALAIDIALHAGEVTYGNVGTPDRLDFTVIGPAVNEVSRVAAMCRSAEREVLVSSAFAAAARPEDRARLVSVGRYALRGVARPEELFTLDPTAQ